MIKKIISLLVILTVLAACSAKGPYNESANAKADIQKALIETKSAHLPLLVIFGANWCPDCRALDKALSTGEYAGKISKEFKLVKVNVGNFDTNLEVANEYGNPIQGGIPGAVFLTPENKVIYVTKPGELATARENGDKALYDFLKNAANNNPS